MKAAFLTRNTDGNPSFYGQINKGFLVHSDGNGTHFFPLVDNSNSSPRAGISCAERWCPSVTEFANVEASWNTYSGNSVSQTEDNRFGLDAATLRKAELSIEFERLGRFRVGQGATASNRTSEIDHSGTAVAARSAVADIAGGQFYAFEFAPGLSAISIATTFRNFDGLGRLMHVRYDSPRFRDIHVSTSFGYDALNGLEDLQWDIAAHYLRDREDENYLIEAAAAFSVPDLGLARANGSVSVKHKPTGLSQTLAGGHDARESTTRRAAIRLTETGLRTGPDHAGPDIVLDRRPCGPGLPDAQLGKLRSGLCRRPADQLPGQQVRRLRRLPLLRL